MEKFPTEASKAEILETYVLEAEVLLKYNDDYVNASSIIRKVLDTDALHFRALIIYAYILLYYEGNYKSSLDYLLRAKLVNPKSSQVWNLLGH